jgi:hypothetical protein
VQNSLKLLYGESVCRHLQRYLFAFQFCCFPSCRHTTQNKDTPFVSRARLRFPAGILRNPVIPFFQAFGEEL